MADFTRREYVTRHVEYVVPDGCAIGEFSKAYGAAMADYRRLNSIGASENVFDDWAHVFTGDDKVIIRFEVKEPPR